MPQLQSIHNANLSMTLSNLSTSVNRSVSTYHPQEKAASYLYVKIDNRIFNYQLSMREIEYYILFSYLITTNPQLIFSARTVQALLKSKLGYNLNPKTICKYNKTLREANLLSIQGRNKLVVLGIDNKTLNPIRSSLHQSNYYIAPKSNFTNFYPMIMEQTRNLDLTAPTPVNTVAKGAMVLEQYFASHNFTNINNPYSTYRYQFRPLKISKDLNCSPKTYYSKLKCLLVNNVLSKVKSNRVFKQPTTLSVSCNDTFPSEGLIYGCFTSCNIDFSTKLKTFRGEGVSATDGRGKASNWNTKPPFSPQPITYLNTLRIKIIDIIQPILTTLRIQSYNQHFLRTQIRQTKTQQDQQRTIHNSRHYHTGILGQYMTKYQVKYSKFMNEIDPELALEIIENLEYRYQRQGKTINAKLISSALKGGWGIEL